MSNAAVGAVAPNRRLGWWLVTLGVVLPVSRLAGVLMLGREGVEDHVVIHDFVVRCLVTSEWLTSLHWSLVAAANLLLGLVLLRGAARLAGAGGRAGAWAGVLGVVGLLAWGAALVRWDIWAYSEQAFLAKCQFLAWAILSGLVYASAGAMLSGARPAFRGRWPGFAASAAGMALLAATVHEVIARVVTAGLGASLGWLLAGALTALGLGGLLLALACQTIDPRAREDIVPSTTRLQ